MSNFMDGIKSTLNNECNVSVTENGAVGFRTTGKALLDLNFAVASLRSASEHDISQRFTKAFFEDKLMAMKWLFYARDARGGLGERRLFRACMVPLAKEFPEYVAPVVALVPEYGRWDDLWCLLDTPACDCVTRLVKGQLYDDTQNAAEGKPISLLAKWMPRCKTSSKQTRHYAQILRKAVGMTERQYQHIYILQRPATSGDGVSEVKHITGYSIEQLFEKKKLYLEEGTYNFWNPVQPEDTILGRILELDTTWSIGYVDPKLIGCYRTFDEYDSDALSFCYGSAMEKYNCTIVFDVYARTISAYDAGKSRGTVPIYLSYQNLVDAVDLEELTDDMVTKLHLYGSDDLSIRDVNPIGTDYMVNLSYFISNGDFDVIAEGSTVTLAERVKSWNAAIKSNQTHYTNLVAARASRTAQRLAEEATLASLKGDLEVLTTQQSVIIQAMALESTAAGKTSQQQQLTEINEKISAKNSEIEAQETVIANLQAEIDRYTTDIQGVVEQLSISKYFTKAEQKILNHYLIEGEAAEETFVATDVDTSASGAISTLQGEVTLTGADITQASLNGKSMYAIAGGVLKIASAKLTADIVRGTLEVNPSTNEYVLTVYMGSNPIEDIGTICMKRGILFHTDCVQAAGCYPIDVVKIGCDFLSVSSHKIHGCKGVGALYAKDKSKLAPIVYGGSEQEFGLRGGTENVAGIVGFGKACEISSKSLHEDTVWVSTLKQRFFMALNEALKDTGDEGCVHVNGMSILTPGKTINLRMDGVDGETLLLMLDGKGVCVSAGSACRSHEAEPSHVLSAMGLSKDEARASIRISFSKKNTADEAVRAAQILAGCISTLRVREEKE